MSELAEKVVNEVTEFNEFESQLAEFKNKYDNIIYDLTIPEDEKQARSDRLTIGKVIANLDRKHKELKAPLKEKVDLIDGERKRIKDDLLNVQDKIKSQIQSHEDAIQAHAEKLQAMVESIYDYAEFADPPTSDRIAERIELLKKIDIDDTYEHRKADATLAHVDTMKKLVTMLADRVQYEEDQAELERLRVEAEARAQKDREDAIRKEAAEAEKAEQEKIRLEAEKRAERALKEAQEESDRKAKEAEERGRKEAEAAHAKREQERIEAERKAEEAKAKEAAKKEKQVHRNKIHKEAKQSFIDNGFTEEQATEAVTLIKEGKIKNVNIIY